MIIRKAYKEDAPQVAKLIFLAMTEIVYQFIGQEDKEESIRFLTKLAEQEGNQFSYTNIFVAEENGSILGQISLYPGEQLKSLRQPVLDLIKKQYNINYLTEDETEAGEIYLDTIAVNPNTQGKGIGKQLIQYIIEEYVNKQKQTLGLLVDKDNPNAKRLYERMGFQKVKDKIVFGKELEHMQYAYQN